MAVKVNNLAPGSHHALNIVAGSCATPGASALALPDLIAGPKGGARLLITVPTAAGIDLAATGYAVAVSEGSGATAGATIACGDVKARAVWAKAKVKTSVAGGMSTAR